MTKKRQKFDDSISFKLTKELKKSIKKEAKKQGFSMSKWLRKVLSGMVYISDLLDLEQTKSFNLPKLNPPSAYIVPITQTKGIERKDAYSQVIAELKIVLQTRKEYVELNQVN